MKLRPKVVLDTNIIISSLVYGGNPQKIFDLVLDKKIIFITSPVLLAELTEKLVKKFNFNLVRIKQIEKIVKNKSNMVWSEIEINILKDEDDNRVLEAAAAGNCDFIITGDKELLKLKEYKQIKIVSAKDFLDYFYQN